MKKFFVGLMITLSIQTVLAQKSVQERGQLWLGYFNQTRLTNKFGIWCDVHARALDLPGSQGQYFIRPALIYYITDQVRLMGGYCYVFNTSPKNLHTNWNEHRPWQQIWIRQKYNGFQTLQWLRFEQRFVQKVVNDQLTGDYGFNFRFRYSYMLTVPLIGKEIKAKIPFFVVQDEIFINAGKEIVYNYFDQNRFFIGLGYTFSDHLNMQVGYSNIFQQKPAGNQFIDNHAIRVSFYHSLDLRKKEY